MTIGRDTMVRNATNVVRSLPITSESTLMIIPRRVSKAEAARVIYQGLRRLRSRQRDGWALQHAQ